MEGDGSVSPSSSATPIPIKTMMTSTSPRIPPPSLVGGCSGTASTAEGKRLKTDIDDDGGEDLPRKSAEGAEVEDKDDKDEVSVGGSGMPLVREQLHPLQNPVILAHLFERCPPSLLRQCRLVSKQWLDISLTSWRATAPLRLYHFRRVNRPDTLLNYLCFMTHPENKCGVKPHRKMKLVSWRNDLNKERLQSFWNDLGRNLTSLEFHSSQFKEVGDLRRIIFGSCPNLKLLSLRDCKFLKSARVEDFRVLKFVEPPFGEQTNLRVLSVEMPGYDQEFHRLSIHWLELLSHFPCLTSLKVSLNRRFLPRAEPVHDELFMAIEIIRQRDAKKLSLRNFELSPSSLKFFDDIGPHPDLSQFEELQLPLQFLEIELLSSNKPRNLLLEDVLSRHRNTLLRITVNRNGCRFSHSPDSWWFPCNVALEKLEELRIHMLCTSMEFLKNTLKLKKLEFLEAPGYGHGRLEETNIFPEAERAALLPVKLLHLTEFRMDYRMTSEDIAIFAGLMPNVSKLTMSLSDKLFWVVCGQSWENLKELEVLGEDLTDKGVTGLDGEGKKISPTDITNLQGLEVFKFWSQELTDLSVFHGFLKLPNLKVLRVCDGVGIMPLGERARESLRAQNVEFQGRYEDEWDYPCDGGHDFHCFSDSVDEDEPNNDLRDFDLGDYMFGYEY